MGIFFNRDKKPDITDTIDGLVRESSVVAFAGVIVGSVRTVKNAWDSFFTDTERAAIMQYCSRMGTKLMSKTAALMTSDADGSVRIVFEVLQSQKSEVMNTFMKEILGAFKNG